MRMKKWVEKSLCACGIAALTAGMLAGCGDSSASASASQESSAATGAEGSSAAAVSSTASSQNSGDTLTLGIVDWPGSYWWFATKELGYFDKEGVNVNVQLFSNYNDGLNSLIGGNIDMFVPSLDNTIPGFADGAEYKIVMVEDYSSGADGLIASKDIKSVADLKGKTIGVEFGGSDHVFLLKALANAGLTEYDVNLVDMSTGDASNAFISGKVDAAAIWEPSLSMAQEETGGNILVTTADKDYEGLIPAVLAVNNSTLEKDRDGVERVMKAWFESQSAYTDDQDAFAKAVADNTEVSADEFLDLMKGCKVLSADENVPVFQDGDTYVSLDYCLQTLAQFEVDNNIISAIPDNLNDLVDSSLFDDVYKELDSNAKSE